MDIDAGNPALAVNRVASARSSTRSDIEAASVAGSASYTAADEKKRRATSNDGQEDAVPSSDSDIGRDEERGAAPAPAQDDHGRPHYSKVRLLSLVLTVTGAAFLNVRVRLEMHIILIG